MPYNYFLYPKETIKRIYKYGNNKSGWRRYNINKILNANIKKNCFFFFLDEIKTRDIVLEATSTSSFKRPIMNILSNWLKIYSFEIY